MDRRDETVRRRWGWIVGLALAELAALFVLFFTALSRGRSPREIDLSFPTWSSPDAVYNGGFSADAAALGEEKHDFLTSPGIRLARGAYRLHLEYMADAPFKTTVSGGVKDGRYVEGGTFRLSNLRYAEDYRFEVTERDDILISVEYGGEGALSVYGAALYTDNAPWKRAFAWAFLLFVILDLGLLLRQWVRRERGVLLSLAAIVGLACLPYGMRGVGWGHDIYFHLMRIDALAQELGRGTFPVRMSAAWIYGYGYPASILYGDFLLYFPAMLRLLGFRVLESYKCYVAFIHLLTALAAFACFRRIFRRRSAALLLTLVYVTSTARLVAVYVRAAVGEYSAMLFIPLIGLGMWELYAEARPEGGLRERLRGVLPLGLGMAGVVCTHVLSTQMLLVALLLAALLLLPRTIRPDVLARLLAAALICVLASLCFTVPFLDYYAHVDLAVKGSDAQALLVGIQPSGIRIGELFSFFHSPFGFSDRTQIDDRFLLTPGPILMFALVAAVFLCLLRGGREGSGRLRFLCLYAGLLLWLSTDAFPWNLLIARTPLGLYLAQVQFPYRYVDIAVFPLTLVLGFLAEELPEELGRYGIRREGLAPLLVGMSFLMTGAFISGYYKGMKEIDFHDTAEMNAIGAIDGGEYLLSGIDDETLSPLYRTEGLAHFAPVSRDGLRHVFEARAAAGGGWVDVPVFSYPYVGAVDGDGRRLATEVGEENRMLRVLLPEGFDGQVTTGFFEPLGWRAAELASFLTILGLAAWAASGMGKERRPSGVGERKEEGSRS